MAFIQSGQATLAQLFLPHAVGRNGRTFYEEVLVNPTGLLLPGEVE